jgi:hypothetical protein
MAKIMIYEDDPRDLVSRYSSLNENHDVHVRLTSIYNEDEIREAGFDFSKIEKIIIDDLPEEMPEADVYFTDGLVGNCFKILEKLPKERSYLLTDHGFYRMIAKNEGYQLADGFLEDIIESVLKNN